MEEKNSSLWWVLGIIVVLGLGYLLVSQKPAGQEAVTNTGSPSAAAPAASDTITIGSVAPLTGDAAPYGLAEQTAEQLAVEQINAAGGIAGKHVAIAYEDGQCDGKAGATAGEKLINVTKVQAIIGGACSGETLGLAPLANQDKVVVISPSASSPDITTKGGDYVFRLYPSDALAGKVAAQYALRELHATHAAILSENTDYAQGLRKVFSDEFKANGGDVAVDEAYDTGMTDFRTQALKIKNSNAQVVYILPQAPTSGLAILKALKEQKVNAKFLTAEVLIAPETVKSNADVMESVIGFEAYFDESGDKAKAFLDAYKAKYNAEPGVPLYAANAYSAVYLLKDLIEKNGYDGAKLQTALTQVKGWSGGALSGVNLDQNGDIDWRTYAVKEAKAGTPTQLSTFTF